MTANILAAILMVLTLATTAYADEPTTVQATPLPKEILGGKSSWIIAKLTAAKKENVTVKYEVTGKSPCGTLDLEETKTNKQGEAKATFTGADVPDTCEATIKVSVDEIEQPTTGHGQAGNSRNGRHRANNGDHDHSNRVVRHRPGCHASAVPRAVPAFQRRPRGRR